jgi:putative N-acetylmannosamine-6-phosphate epimerase
VAKPGDKASVPKFAVSADADVPIIGIIKVKNHAN